MLALILFVAAQEFDRVHLGEATGEITLAGRNAVLREQPRVAKRDVITDMVVYRGRLIATAGMSFGRADGLAPYAYSDASDVLEYSREKEEWTVLREMQASMFFNVRVVGDLLMLPEFHPTRSRTVHTFDGRTWDALGLLPAENWHLMDVIRIGDRLYVSGSWRDADADAKRNDPNWRLGYGHVFESADGGRTWKDIRRTREPGRVLDMVEFQGRLWANERGMQLISWDGREWTEVPVKAERGGIDPKLGNAHLAVFAGRILAIHAALIYTFDGRRWASSTPGCIDLWREAGKLYGLREDGNVCVTDDAVQWTRVTKEGVPAREFDRQAAGGRPLHRGALAMYRGRLFVGTGAEGRIYAAPYEERGSFTSKPARFEPGATVTLSWEGGVRMRIRTAEARDDLEKALWKDVAASPAAVTLPRRHRWAQYRATFESDGTRTPILRSHALGTP